MTKTKVLIIENDEVTALHLQMALEKQGYLVISITDNILSAKQQILQYKPDIAIIDITLQERNDGIILADFIHKKQLLPFIFLTAHADDLTIANASKVEPAGYLVKPFNPLNLHVTIQIALHKYSQEQQKNKDLISLQTDNQNLKKLIFGKKPNEPQVVSFGNGYCFHTEACETYYKGEAIRLTRKENLFIQLLISNLGSIVSFEDALKSVWGDENVSENNVRTLVWRLRNKLHTDVIKNASGSGYYIEEHHSIMTLAS